MLLLFFNDFRFLPNWLFLIASHDFSLLRVLRIPVSAMEFMQVFGLLLQEGSELTILILLFLSVTTTSDGNFIEQKLNPGTKDDIMECRS